MFFLEDYKAYLSRLKYQKIDKLFPIKEGFESAVWKSYSCLFLSNAAISGYFQYSRGILHGLNHDKLIKM